MAPKLPTVESTVLLFGSWQTVKRHFNIVLLGDGYTSAELGEFATHASTVADALVGTAPFDRMRGSLNIFRMNLVSAESWNSPALQAWYQKHRDDALAAPNEAARLQVVHHLYCSMPPTNTALKARFCHSGEEREMFGDQDLAMAVARSNPEIPDVHGVVTLINSTQLFGGSGGKTAWSTLNNLIPTAIHELGHQGFALADEYHYDHASTEHAPFIGAEPVERNVSTSAHPSFPPWAQLLTPGVPLPTSGAHGAGCPVLTDAQRPNGTFDVLAANVNSVGAFEGGKNRLCGIFHPALKCKMRVMADDFCAVCQQIIVEKLGTHMFGNARTKGEIAVDVCTQVLTFTPLDVDAEISVLTYDMGSGSYAIYPCYPFAEGLLLPKAVRGTIAPYWTALKAVMFDGALHVLALQRGSGLTALYRVADDGTSLSFARGTSAPGLSVALPFGLLQIVDFQFADDLHYLEYDILTGDAVIRRVERATTDPVLVRTRALGRGRLGFTAFTLATDTRTHFYSYDFTTGNIELHRIDNDDVTSVWSAATLMGAGWSDLLPLQMYDGSRFLLLHSRVSGIQRIFRIRNDGQGLEYVYTDKNAGRGPYSFVSFSLDGRTYYLRYRWPLLGKSATLEALHAN